MREILFRGKRVSDDKWIYGDFTDQRFDEPSIWDDGYRIEINSKTIGQYTGLKDKNGNKIFEGDIVKQNYYRDKERDVEVVKLENGGFFPFAIAGWECTPEAENVEVIGNIYESETE